MKGDFEFNIKGNIYDPDGRDLLVALLKLANMRGFRRFVDYVAVNRYGEAPPETGKKTDPKKAGE